MKRWRRKIGASAIALTMMFSGLAVSVSTASAAEIKDTQTLSVDYAKSTGAFEGGASGTLYGLGDSGSPTDAILDGARIENSSQKPPFGTQHPSGDSLALDSQFFANGGKELAVYIQDYYPDWSYNGGKRPGDARSYKLDVPVDDPTYGTYTNQPDGVWDYAEVTEIVMNKILSTTEHPDQYTFIPFNEPDGGNWYYTNDDATNALFSQTFLSDWDSEYQLIQKIWKQYQNGTDGKIAAHKASNGIASVAGPGDSAWRQNRSDAFLAHAKSAGTLPEVFVWHELGKGSLESFRSHYDAYRALEKKYGIVPLRVNITEYGELRDMSVPGQLIQWMSMFEEKKVQAETAYWNYAGNLSDNMARANSANAGWWLFKWYGDMRGSESVAVTSQHPNTIDNLQGIATLDTTQKKATVIYGGANDSDTNALNDTGANIPVKVHITGLDSKVLTNNVDVEVRENAYTGPDGVAGTPKVVNAASNVALSDGTLDVTTNSVDRYASYQLVITPHQDRSLTTDVANNHATLVAEAESTQLNGAQAYTKTPLPSGWTEFMFSGNGDVGSFGTGDTVTWNVNIPADGDYRLESISGNTGFSGQNAVSVNGQDAGVLNYGAELANKDSAKWKYRGSAELVLTGLKKGENAITLHGSAADNTLDKFLLYQLGKDGKDLTEYPASQFRFSGDARLSYDGQGTNGFAQLNDGSADIFAQAWQAGYHDVSVSYNAAKGSQIKIKVNGTTSGTITAAHDGLQTSTLHLAMSEGINQITLTSDSKVYIRDLTTAISSSLNNQAISMQAEDLNLAGGAKVVNDANSNAVGSSYVSGLGNQFVTKQDSTVWGGDTTRVNVLDSSNTPEVIENNRGMMTVAAGKVPAGTYNVVVRYSNNAFIGKHDYNPQIVDLGLQATQNGAEISRGAFRYTFSGGSFLNRSLLLTTDGSSIVFGNWDPNGLGKGAVSHGVAPNIDSLTFYPVAAGETESTIDPTTLVGISADPTNQNINIGDPLSLKVTATYADGSTRDLNTGDYAVDGFDSSSVGKKSVTITYQEHRVTRTANVAATVDDASKSVDKSALQSAISAVLKLRENSYTSASWAVLHAALADAKRVNEDASATQQEVDSALKALLNAKNALKAATSNPSNGGNGGNGNNEQTNSKTAADRNSGPEANGVIGGLAHTGSVLPIWLLVMTIILASTGYVLKIRSRHNKE
ncbi:bacterial Ig-like domain-containing protein [Bifidobacterium aquikefiri]|uniref:bacterial Ig-like domain-containing protein n=1 Tax=Bifidobacterium aquikefiri TaxID=1653207 RepID=UPI0039EB0DB6